MIAKIIAYGVFGIAILYLYALLIWGGIYLPSHTVSPTKWQGVSFLMFVTFVSSVLFLMAITRDIAKALKKKAKSGNEPFNESE